MRVVLNSSRFHKTDSEKLRQAALPADFFLAAMSVIPGQDLISLGSLFASNLDDAAFVARRSETDVRLAALRREHETSIKAGSTSAPQLATRTCQQPPQIQGAWVLKDVLERATRVPSN